MGGEGELAASGLGQHRLRHATKRAAMVLETMNTERLAAVGADGDQIGVRASARSPAPDGVPASAQVRVAARLALGEGRRVPTVGIADDDGAHAALTLSRRRSRLRSWAVVAPHTPSVQTGRLMT